MSKAERKAERRRILAEQERVAREEARGLALVTPRDPSEGCFGYGFMRLSEAGTPLLQLVRRPSLGLTVCYEIRDIEGELALFRSTSEEPEGRLVVGYDLLAADQSVLRAFVAAIDGLSVPIRRSIKAYGTVDGVRYELFAQSGSGVSARFMWCHEDAPPGGNCFRVS